MNHIQIEFTFKQKNYAVSRCFKKNETELATRSSNTYLNPIEGDF